MALVFISAPSVEPIALADAKAQLRIDTNDEDALLASLIATGRSHLERTLGLALITQSWAYYLDHWPRSGVIALPVRPVQAVNAVNEHSAIVTDPNALRAVRAALEHRAPPCVALTTALRSAVAPVVISRTEHSVGDALSGLEVKVG